MDRSMVPYFGMTALAAACGLFVWFRPAPSKGLPWQPLEQVIANGPGGGQIVRKCADGEAVVIRAALLDLDGTLVDSAMTWYKVLNAAAVHFGFPPIGFDDWQGTFGQPMEANIDKWMRGGDAIAIEAFTSSHYWDYIEDVSIMDGAVEALTTLRSVFGNHLALVTNCPRTITQSILERTSLGNFFSVVTCAGDAYVPAAIPVSRSTGVVDAIRLRAKPDVDLIAHACALLGVRAQETVFVGDSKNDMLAGRQAGTHTIGVGVDGGTVRLNAIRELSQYLAL
eukprot:c32788_g1_i1.p2 GENE.c32788_g1_i1~~c32788_g1_i1.p2  ORF type:complete len:282 (-),score=37.44 c32788_g1_i1:242-1087(-)